MVKTLGQAWTALYSLLLFLACTPATAGTLKVSALGADRAPVGDAVVTVRATGRNRQAGPARPAPARRTIDQKDLAFIPTLEVFRPGDEVVFRNSDRTRHHVYSFSRAKSFEFVLAPQESSPPLRLDRTGTIAVGCNIHDSMIAWLYVTDAPWSARTGADGLAEFGGLPPGEYEVRVWHPRSKPGRGEPVRSVTVRADGIAAVSFALSLLPPPLGHEHAQY